MMEKRVMVGWWGYRRRGLEGGKTRWCRGGRDGRCIALVVEGWT